MNDNNSNNNSSQELFYICMFRKKKKNWQKVSKAIRRIIINQKRKELIVLCWTEDADKLNKEEDPGSNVGVSWRSERTQKLITIFIS